jgi:hypothetical protein
MASLIRVKSAARRSVFRSILVVENALAGALEILVLARAQRPEERR